MASTVVLASLLAPMHRFTAAQHSCSSALVDVLKAPCIAWCGDAAD